MRGKVLFVILSLVGLFLSPFAVYAQEYKIEDIESNFKKTMPLQEEDMGQEFYNNLLDKMVTTIDGNNLLITFDVENNQIKRNITLENNVLTYYGDEKAKDKGYREDLNNLSAALSNIMIDSVLVNQMMYAVSLTKGYSDDDFVKFMNSYSTEEDSEEDGWYIDPVAEKYGITAVVENYEQKDESGSVSMGFLLSFSVDLNKFDLSNNDVPNTEPENQGTVPETNPAPPTENPTPDNNPNQNNQSNPTTNNNPSASEVNKNDGEIENPQTGEEFPYILILLGIIGIFLLYFKKKNSIYKI